MDENRLVMVTVRGLFGERDLELKLAEGGPTVLTGSNGSGKSTILRIVYAVSAQDLGTLVSAPIETLSLTFSDIPPFMMRRSHVSEHEWILDWGDNHDIVTSQAGAENLPDWASEALRENDYDPKLTIEHLFDYVRAADVRPTEYRAVREFLESMSEQILRVQAPPWMSQLQDVFPAVFITDQRLVVEPDKRAVRSALVHGVGKHARRSTTTRAVEAASNEIAAQISRADSNYARNSQLVDRRFPADVIKAMQFERETSRKSVEALIKDVDRERESLRLVGLLDSDIGYQPALGVDELDIENVRPVVSTFLQSTLAKLKVLQHLATRLTAFKEFLDTRFQPKSISLSRTSGLTIMLPNGNSLRPTQLSSGEQQMIVLAFEILFNTKPGTLVIIDEPEISLHVLWQDSLIDDLETMARPSRLQFMMATHSPAILADHPELERSLDGLM
jgi:ABC-type lipoprotein export system ATPase subunit